LTSSAPFHPAGKRRRLLLQKHRRHRSPPAAPRLRPRKQRSSQFKNTRSPSSPARRPHLPRSIRSPERPRRRPTVPHVTGVASPVSPFLPFPCCPLDSDQRAHNRTPNPNRYQPVTSCHVAAQSASPVKLVKIDLEFEMQISDFCCNL
jgi:hypothetical protein